MPGGAWASAGITELPMRTMAAAAAADSERMAGPPLTETVHRAGCQSSIYTPGPYRFAIAGRTARAASVKSGAGPLRPGQPRVARADLRRLEGVVGAPDQAAHAAHQVPEAGARQGQHRIRQPGRRQIARQ